MMKINPLPRMTGLTVLLVLFIHLGARNPQEIHITVLDICTSKQFLKTFLQWTDELTLDGKTLDRQRANL